jgi:hypothetical protein
MQKFHKCESYLRLGEQNVVNSSVDVKGRSRKPRRIYLRRFDEESESVYVRSVETQEPPMAPAETVIGTRGSGRQICEAEKQRVNLERKLGRAAADLVTWSRPLVGPIRWCAAPQGQEEREESAHPEASLVIVVAGAARRTTNQVDRVI